MENLPVIPFQNDSQSTRDRKTISQIKKHKVINSTDLVIKEGPHGTTISLNPKHKHNHLPLEWVSGSFNPNASAYPHQVVRVTTADVTAHPFLSSSIGTWRCCFQVPDKDFSDAFVSAGLDATTYPGYIRVPGVIYYPVSPEPANLPASASAAGRYWEMMGGSGDASAGLPVWV